MSLNNKQLGKRINAEMASAKDKAASSIEAAINAGDLLIQARARSAGDFNGWLARYCDVEYAQATKLIRLATHKEATRLAAKSGATSINAIQKLIPKTSEPVAETRADPESLAYTGAKPGPRNSNDWHTPAVYISMAKEVMGAIDLDPFSSHQANETVGAKHILTESDDALIMTWPKKSRVWMNPPFSKGLSEKCVAKFQQESPQEAIVLMNASTDTKWFHSMAAACDVLCLTLGRISFVDAGGKNQSGNTRGQVFFYYGPNEDKFIAVFSEIGLVL